MRYDVYLIKNRMISDLSKTFITSLILMCTLTGCYSPVQTSGGAAPADVPPGVLVPAAGDVKTDDDKTDDVITDDKDSNTNDEITQTEDEADTGGMVMAEINLNQIGYRPHDEKRAVIRDISTAGGVFDVYDTMSGSIVLHGDITKGSLFGSSHDNVGYADFTSVTAGGTYKIVTGSGQESYEFMISDNVYEHAFTDALRMFYLQRCGCELSQSLAGDFAHAPCHTDEARLYGGKKYVDVTGGWHDAGDYGRYVSPGAKSVADLMLAYELYPDRFKTSLRIPESGNGVPDVLNEVRYELEWMMKMQDTDGGVHHKVTGLEFEDFIMSDEVDAQMYLLPESTTATADFSASMFMASRVYSGIDKEFSDRCLDCAFRSLEAYRKHANDSGFTNPSDCNTGEYADECSADEYLWAICEGYKTTGDEKFEKLLASFDMSKITVDGFGWDAMSGYAYYAYLSAPKPMTTDPGIANRFFGMVDKIRELAHNESYGCTIEEDYPWGSNMIVANNAMALLLANSLKENPDYTLCAKRQLDYLFGTNTTSYCFLTGYGKNSPLHPHHRPSVAKGKCMPGMLVGGPASGLFDPVAQANLAGKPKAACYIDEAMSYSCNEVTIYWNSPLCFVLAGLGR